MEKQTALHRIEKRLYKPTCALLGLTLFSGVGTVAERSFEFDTAPEATFEIDVSPLEDSGSNRMELSADKPVTQEIAAANPDTANTIVEPIPQETATPPVEETAEVAAPASTLPASEPAPAPAEAIAQELPVCPVEWSAVGQSICYSKRGGFHVLRIDMTDPDISVCPEYTIGPGRLGLLSEAAKRLGAVAAVNSPFFYKSGRNLGPLACQGRWLSRDPYPQAVFEYRVDGSIDTKYTKQALASDVASLEFAVSGSHVLVDDGQIIQDFGKDNKDGVLYRRHYRTAIGMDQSETLYMAVTEKGHKATMPELAGFMGSLGVREALNMDGGGSSNMMVNHHNVAAKGNGEREISAGLFVTTNSR